MIFYRIISEWDFGQEYCIFRTTPKAIEWLKNDLNVQEFLNNSDEFATVENLIGEGLISFDIVQLVD